MRQQLQQLEPFVPVFNGTTALHPVGERTDRTPRSQCSRCMPPDGPEPRPQRTRQDLRGRRAVTAKPPTSRYSEMPSGPFLRERWKKLRGSCAQRRRRPSPQRLPRLGYLGFVYLYVGAPDRFLSSMRECRSRLFAAGTSLSCCSGIPSYAPVRKTERFKASCGLPALSIIGARRAGPTSAARWAQTISSAIEALSGPRARMTH